MAPEIPVVVPPAPAPVEPNIFQKILNSLVKSDAVKRMAVFVISSLIILLKNKLGLDLSDEQVALFAAGAVAFLLQSGFHAAAKTNAQATLLVAKLVPDKAAAIAELRKGPKP